MIPHSPKIRRLVLHKYARRRCQIYEMYPCLVGEWSGSTHTPLFLIKYRLDLLKYLTP
jgi:hypothetical protein